MFSIDCLRFGLFVLLFLFCLISTRQIASAFYNEKNEIIKLLFKLLLLMQMRKFWLSCQQFVRSECFGLTFCVVYSAGMAQLTFLHSRLNYLMDSY